MALCDAAVETGGRTEKGARVAQPCRRDATAVRYSRIGPHWMVRVRLCGPHTELWDMDTSAATSDVSTIESGGG